MAKTKSEKKPKENTKSTNKASRGLGDTIEKITTATGIKKAVEWLANGKDCGCDARKDYLNKIFPYNKPNCLIEHEYEYLKDYYSKNKNTVPPSVQRNIIDIYNRVFNDNKTTTSCSKCFLTTIHNNLKKVYEQYESDKKQKQDKAGN